MTNVHDITDRLESIRSKLDKSGEPPDNGDMDARVSKLESAAQDVRERLVKIDTRLDHIEKDLATNMATKDFVRATVTEAKNSIIMWLVSAVLLAQLLPSLLKKFGL